MRTLILFILVFPQYLFAQNYSWVSRVSGVNNAEIKSNAADVLSSSTYAAGSYSGDLTTSFPLLLVASDDDGILIKYDNTGGVLWYTGVHAFNARINDVCVDPSGNVYVIGDFEGGFDPGTGLLTSAGNLDVFILKYNSAGTLLWGRSAGGVNDDHGYAISADNNYVYVGGEYEGLASFSGTNTNNYAAGGDAFLAAYDLSGNIQWVRDFGAVAGPFMSNHDMIVDIETDGSNVFAYGQFESKNFEIRLPPVPAIGSYASVSNANSGATPDADIFLVSFTNAGGFNYVQTIASNLNDDAGGISLLSGQLYVCGSVSQNAILPSGANLGTTNAQDIFLANLDPATGIDTWGKTEMGVANGGDYDIAHDITASSNGKIYITGDMGGDVNFNNDGLISKVGGQGIFVASYCDNGTFSWVETAGSGGDDYSYSICSNNDDIYHCGLYEDNGSFGSFGPYINVSGDDGYHAKLIETTSCCASPPVGGSASITGTPFCPGDNVNLSLSGQNGSIVWEESTDGGITWSDITGANTSNETVSPSGETYYRARLSNPNCTDAYSDTVVALLESQPPTFTCLSDINDNTDVSCNYILPDYTTDPGLVASVADNCPGAVTITQNIPPGTNVGSGQYDIWLYFQDIAGNTDSCSFVLTVEAFVGTRIVSCGDTYLGENTASYGNTEDNFTCSGFSTPGTDIYYQITVPNGNYLIQVNLDNMSSATNSFAGMFWLSSSCPGNTCGSSDDFYYDIANQEFTHNNSNTQNFEAVGPGTYFLVIDGLSAGDLQFDISFDCIESGVNFDTDCGGSDLDSNGVITRVNGSTALNVNTCSNYEICNELIIQNNGIEWLDSVVFNLGPCYENISNILPNGVDNGFYNGLGDWTQTNSPGQIIWTFDHSSNPEWGDGSTGNFTCSSFASFCFDADIAATCPDSTGLNIEIEVYDDGSGNANNTTVSFDVATAGGFNLNNNQITMTCPGTQSENLNGSCELSLPDYTAITGVVDNCDSAPTLTQNPAPGTLINMDQIVWIITENSFGVKDSCSFLVQVFDINAPTASCQNINVYLDGVGSATITAADINNGSTDDCSTPTLSISQSSFNCADVAGSPINVTLTVTDTAGNTDNCISQVTVLDTISPNLTCPGNQTISSGAGCSATLPDYTTGVGETDNCGVASVAQSPTAGTVISSSTLVTVTVTDNAGNTRSCSFTADVDDTTDPVASCQNINIYLDGTGSATITAADIDNGSTDNCSTPTLSISQSNFNCADVVASPVNVTLTATDGSGNTASCISQVTVLDTISPNLTCPGNQTISSGAGCSATLPDYTTGVGETDNCGVASVVQSPTAGTVISSSTLVTITVADNAGNTRSCSFTADVDDTTDPVASCQNINVYLDGSGSATITAADIDNGSTDNCSTPTLSISQSSFNCADVAASPVNVTLTATDGSGNTASCVSQLTVLDTIRPNLTCPGNQVLSAGAGCSATLPDYTTGVGETDNCGVASVVQSPTAGTVISSSTLVTVTVTDNAGNTRSCSFTADVDDTTDPVASCQNINVYLDGSGSATITAADIDNGSTDNCSTPSLSISQSSFNCADVSVSPVNVTLTATDGSGNVANCVSQVTVLDTISPNLTCPSNQMLSLDGTCNAILPDYTTGVGATDNCGVASVAQSPVAGTSINASTPVTITVTDNSGNTSDCSFIVNVEDVTAPIASCQNINVYLDGSGSATITAADIDNGSTDNCSTPVLSISQSSFSCADVDLSPINITLTATDTAGNSDNCVAQVAVLDTVAPTALCQNITVYLDASGEVEIDETDIDAGSFDNCTVDEIDIDIEDFFCSDLGTNFVNLSVEDESGNISTCQAQVQVVDTISPVASCQNITVYLDGSGNANIAANDIDNGSADNCGISSLSISQSAFSCSDLSSSPVSVVLTASDNSGNSDNCSALVTVLDTISPSISCPSSITQCDSIVNYSNPIISDNCIGPTLNLVSGLSSGSDFPVGVTNVVYQVLDASGNSNTCSFDVEVLPLINSDFILPDTLCLPLGVYDLETGVTLNNGESQQFFSTNGAQINGNNFLQANNTGPGNFEITHVVSNGFCSDTTIKNIELIATVQNGFDLGLFICSNLNQVNLNDYLDMGVSDTGYWIGTAVMQDSLWDLSGLDGVYALNYIIPQGQCSDTATGSVQVHPDVDPSIDLIDSICESETVLLDNYILGDVGGVFTGPQVTNNVLNTTGLGSYVLISYEVGEIGCQEQDIDSIFVELKPNVFISTDTAICGDSLQFNPNHSGLSTNWLNQADVTFASNNNPNSDIIFSNEGVYELVLESYTQQCVNSDTVNVQVYFEPTIVDAGQDQNIAFTTSTSMDALPPDYGSGTWLNSSGLLIDDPNSESSFIDNLQIGDNELIWSVSNGVCPVSYDTVIVLVKEIEIVSGFSPNNDGKNDYFHIEGLEHLGKVKLSVFNRWGKLVFEEVQYQNDWNGDGFNGSLPADTYYYIIESELSKEYNGYIVIRR